LDIPPVVLGCGNFGGIGSAPAFFGKGETKEQAFDLMDAAWAMGLDWFDTADAYGGGRSEAWIGEWIASRGHRPRITTKTFNPMESGADRGLSRERILRQVETSLQRLGVEQIDLYLAHDYDPDTPLEETVGAFEELLGEGKIGAYGLSNFGAAQLEAALAAGARPACVQNSYSLLERSDELDVIPLCDDHGIAYQAYSPLAGGWLTGKYRRSEPPPSGSRMALLPAPYRHLETDRVYDALEVLAAFAEGHGVGMAAIALAWLLGNPLVDSIVVGPARPEHLESVREAVTLGLTSGDCHLIGSVFRWIF
jgi:aryl-alcohol dehydrogenase-like predicted oxidoreductase